MSSDGRSIRPMLGVVGLWVLGISSVGLAAHELL